MRRVDRTLRSENAVRPRVEFGPVDQVARMVDETGIITISRKLLAEHAAKREPMVSGAQHQLRAKEAPGGQDQHVRGDLLVTAGIAVAEPEILVLDLPATRDFLESGDLGQAAQLDRRIATGVKQMVDDALVQRLARAGKAAQKTPPLALAIGFLVQRGLRVGILDDGEVQRSPILDGIVLARESCVGLERGTRLLQISRSTEIRKRLVIAGWSGEVAACELNRKFRYHLTGFTAIGRHEVLGAVVVGLRELERPVLHDLGFSAIEVRPDRDV